MDRHEDFEHNFMNKNCWYTSISKIIDKLYLYLCSFVPRLRNTSTRNGVEIILDAEIKGNVVEVILKSDSEILW